MLLRRSLQRRGSGTSSTFLNMAKTCRRSAIGRGPAAEKEPQVRTPAATTPRLRVQRGGFGALLPQHKDLEYYHSGWSLRFLVAVKARILKRNNDPDPCH